MIPLCQYPLDVQTETCSASDNFVFLVWPVTVVHKIDSSSPLWNISAEQLLTERFEIIVILEGTQLIVVESSTCYKVTVVRNEGDFVSNCLGFKSRASDFCPLGWLRVRNQFLVLIKTVLINICFTCNKSDTLLVISAVRFLQWLKCQIFY